MRRVAAPPGVHSTLDQAYTAMNQATVVKWRERFKTADQILDGLKKYLTNL